MALFCYQCLSPEPEPSLFCASAFLLCLSSPVSSLLTTHTAGVKVWFILPIMPYIDYQWHFNGRPALKLKSKAQKRKKKNSLAPHPLSALIYLFIYHYESSVCINISNPTCPLRWGWCRGSLQCAITVTLGSPPLSVSGGLLRLGSASIISTALALMIKWIMEHSSPPLPTWFYHHLLI